MSTLPQVHHGGAEVANVAPPGTMGRALHELRCAIAEREGTKLPRREVARRIAAATGSTCPETYPTSWEGGRRRISEAVARRYGAAFGLVPVLSFVADREGARIPTPGAPVPVAATGGNPRTEVSPPGSWARALSDLREANLMLRAELATRLGYESRSRITARESGGADVDEEYVNRVCEVFGVLWKLTWEPGPYTPPHERGRKKRVAKRGRRGGPRGDSR